MTNSISEIDNADMIFVIGTNTTENHPVIGSKIKQAVRRGAKLVVADPREIELKKYADVYLQIKPGTNVALLNGMMNVIIEEGLQDSEFIAERTENYEELKELVKDYTPEKVEEITGVSADLIGRRQGFMQRAVIPCCSTPWALHSTVQVHSTCTQRPTWQCSAV